MTLTPDTRRDLIDEHVDILEATPQIRIAMRYESWYSVPISKRSVEEILDEPQAADGPYRMDVHLSAQGELQFSIDCCNRATRKWHTVADGSESGQSPVERKAWLWLRTKYPQILRLIEIDQVLAEGVVV